MSYSLPFLNSGHDWTNFIRAYRDHVLFSCRGEKGDTYTDLELAAVEAMAAMLSCGKIFDPTGS